MEVLLKRVESQAPLNRYPRAIPLAIFVIGLIITTLFALNLERTDAEARRVALDADADAVANEIERQSSENMAYLKAAGSLFEMSENVSDEQFANVFADLSLDHSARGSLGIGWAQWIISDRAADFARLVAERNPNITFQINPKPQQSGRFMAVISLLQPMNAVNTRALGFDMYSEATRRQAMDSARRTQRPVASGPVTLVQDQNDSIAKGVLVYLPVFERQATSALVAPRLKGFVYTPIRVRNFLVTAVEKSNRSVGAVALYDGTPLRDNLLAAMGTPHNNDVATRAIDFAGRPWTLTVESRHFGGLTRTSMLVFAMGTLISLLLAVIGRTLTSRAAADQRMLERLMRESSIRNSLTRELNHRVKNTLANVLSIVALTKRRAPDLDAFVEGLTGRIRALSATHDLLSRREWKNAPVHDVVTSELAPYLDPQDPHANVDGPDVLLTPNDAMSLGLALHELATNAAKYGALSTPDGRVSVAWSMPTPDLCEIQWRETGGPPVVAPATRGFGMELIERIVSAELGSDVELRFDPAGVTCRLSVPVRTLSDFKLHASAAD